MTDRSVSASTPASPCLETVAATHSHPEVSGSFVPSDICPDHVVATDGSLEFAQRHIGPNASEVQEMLTALDLNSLEQLTAQTVPADIRLQAPLQLPAALNEDAALQSLKAIATQNQIFRSYIGLGYSGCITPPVIQRNILENPGWYTQYTPYQAEIAQGRLEALLNYQTLVCDLTGMEIANASLLDEGTAAAEAMTLCFN
ncbi:MAG TPA: hypothetical protein V6D19_11850, partial [Stenomitos sp.]